MRWCAGVCCCVVAVLAVLASCATSAETGDAGPATLGSGATTGIGTIGSASTMDDGSTAGSGPHSTSTGESQDGTSAAPTGDPDTGTGTSGAGASCPDDPNACTAFVLPVGGARWLGVALDVDSALAPTGPVRAAFDVEATREGIVFTDTHYHVVDLDEGHWVRAATLAADLPEVGGDVLVAAYSVPAYWGAMFGGSQDTEDVTLLSASSVYLYSYDIPSSSFSFVQTNDGYGDAWQAGAAPSPAEVRAAWIDVTNAPGWFDADIPELCGPEVRGRPGPYSAWVGGDSVHTADAGYCWEFATPVPYRSFAPFVHAGAPSIDAVRGALYNETAGLWVFTAS